MTTTHTRSGYTLFELIVVMALLLLLAAVVLPSVGAFRGDTRQKGAADALRGELATARGRAMEEGRPYRIAISQGGNRIRRAPDTQDFGTVTAFGHPDSSAAVVEYELAHVTAEVVEVNNSTSGIVTESGWTTIATVLPNGSCLEDSVIVAVRDVTNSTGMPMRIFIRGLTGTSRILSPTGGMK